MQSCIVSAALSPWLLRLITSYLSEFNIGPKGISGKIREKVRDSSEIDKPQLLANEAAPAESEFGKLSREAKKVLKTLFKFQTEHFGTNYDKRWGFDVGPGAPDYSAYLLSVSELMERGFVYIDSRSFLFLTNEGIQFCDEHRDELDRFPEYYSHFAN